MLERSPLAENALQCLHDEDYGRPYDTRTLNSSTMIFSGGRSGISLDGDWNFCVDLLDTGLRQKKQTQASRCLRSRSHTNVLAA